MATEHKCVSVCIYFLRKIRKDSIFEKWASEETW